MGNFLNTLKRFFANKNTVTILGVLAGVVVLFGFYQYRVKSATTPIKVPYAKRAFSATEEITAEDIGTIEINSKFVNKTNIITKISDLKGKYVTVGTSIPAGGLFYEEQVVTKDKIPNSFYANIPDKHTPYALSVNIHTTFGNSILPGDHIDLWLRATDDNGQIIFGKFIEQMPVLAVKDSAGNDVFGSNVTRTPAELIFAVHDDTYTLLRAAEYISGVTVVVVPRNKNYTDEGGELKTYEYLKNFLLSHMSSDLEYN